MFFNYLFLCLPLKGIMDSSVQTYYISWLFINVDLLYFDPKSEILSFFWMANLEKLRYITKLFIVHYLVDKFAVSIRFLQMHIKLRPSTYSYINQYANIPWNIIYRQAFVFLNIFWTLLLRAKLILEVFICCYCYFFKTAKWKHLEKLIF